MKKYLLMLLAVLMLVGMFAGCGNSAEPPRETSAGAPQSPGKLPKPQDSSTPAETAPVQTEPMVTDASLAIFRQTMVETPQIFAVAYFGYQASFDYDAVVDPFVAMPEKAPQLCEDLPFLLTIPQENVLGGGIGDLFCIVPADPAATVSVNRALWDESSEEYVYEDVIYRSESGEPILLFCNSAEIEPDTQVTITDTEGRTVVWYPRIDGLRCVEALQDEAGNDLFFDFTPYAESLSQDYCNMRDAEWSFPEEADLIGTTWGCIRSTADDVEITYQVTFQDDTCNIRWHDGHTEHIFTDAAWELTCDGGSAVLQIDFQEFAGSLRYVLLLERETELLYVAVDPSDGYVEPGSVPLHQILIPMVPSAPEPDDMIGIWELAWTEVEGDRNEVPPDQNILVITAGGAENSFRITCTDMVYMEESFQDKELAVFDEEMFPDCGNDQWTAYVGYIGPYDTIYSVTLLPDGTLLMQSYWEMDGMPMVSYKWYRRVT